MRIIRTLAAGIAATGLMCFGGVTTAQAEPIKVDKGTTLVSFTFDDGWKGQDDAAKVLTDNGMHGTFYVNSGQIGYGNYMTLETLQKMSAQGHEIGGHTVSHANLSKVPDVVATQEVCDDRATLAYLGFRVTDFAYPYGVESKIIRSIVQSCGYASARDTSGLRAFPEDECNSCPYAEDVADMDNWRIRSNPSTEDFDEFKTHIQNAEKHGGGLVPLVFHHVCDCPEKGDERISLAEFKRLVEWVSEQPDVQVVTMDQAVGGADRTIVGNVNERFAVKAPPPISVGDGLSDAHAFTILGIGIGLKDIIIWGVTFSTVAIVMYRMKTRGSRYVTK